MTKLGIQNFMLDSEHNDHGKHYSKNPQAIHLVSQRLTHITMKLGTHILFNEHTTIITVSINAVPVKQQ